jgi:hypothetical protein
MLSVKKVMNALQEAGFINDWSKRKQDASLDEDGSLMETVIDVDSPNGNVIVGNEVFGNNAMLYFYCADGLTAKRIAQLLRNMGGEPNFRWCGGNPALFELQVSYFKGCRWWE